MLGYHTIKLMFFNFYIRLVLTDGKVWLKLMTRPWLHFRTITKHRHNVIIHCWKAGILWRGLIHDLSNTVRQNSSGVPVFIVGHHSPIVEERKTFGFSKAWLNHKGRNKHHLEYWTDYCLKTKTLVGVQMPIKYFVEMICDRMAASNTYNGDAYTDASPLEYHERIGHANIIHSTTDVLLQHALTLLANEGEDALFAWLRELLRMDRVKRRQNGFLSKLKRRFKLKPNRRSEPELLWDLNLLYCDLKPCTQNSIE